MPTQPHLGRDFHHQQSLTFPQHGIIQRPPPHSTSERPPTLPFPGVCHVLQSHDKGQSDPPDLFGALLEEQVSPAEEDMNHSDPKMTPFGQDLRFKGDFYTPKWVRGQGNSREGWCGICKPGRWLVLKNSAFWYHKLFIHGVRARGLPFEGPSHKRYEMDDWEGYCTTCNDWIPLGSKERGVTWFRHAYKVSRVVDSSQDSAKTFTVANKLGINSVTQTQVEKNREEWPKLGTLTLSILEREMATASITSISPTPRPVCQMFL